MRASSRDVYRVAPRSPRCSRSGIARADGHTPLQTRTGTAPSIRRSLPVVGEPSSRCSRKWPE
ncbi:hypothetical protein BC827DRAFT_1229683, partial [Russula dissimulans]